MDDIEKAKRLLDAAGYTVLKKPKKWCKYKEVVIGLSGPYRKDRRDFVKFYSKVWSVMAEKDILSGGEYKFLMRAFPFCEYNSNCLVMIKDGEVVPMGFSDVVKVSGYEEKQTRRILKSLIDKNLMCYIYGGLTDKYAVNPELYWRGGNADQHGILKAIFYSRHKELKDNAKLAKQQMRALYINGRASSILYEKQKKHGT